MIVAVSFIIHAYKSQLTLIFLQIKEQIQRLL